VFEVRTEMAKACSEMADKHGEPLCCYRMKPHQSAKTAVAKMVVMAIEISNEIAVSLIQSVTSQFPVGPIAGPGYVDILIVMLWPFMQHAVAIFHRCVIVDREQARFETNYPAV
jgi:hypothetical protein